MRDILFRAKIGADNGEYKKGDWVYGDYVRISDGKTYSFPHIYGKGAIIPMTVGEYTGFKDKNGTKIFEGDILIMDEHTSYPFEMIFSKKRGGFFAVNKKKDLIITDYANSEVIGNIFDNSELLGGESRNG